MSAFRYAFCIKSPLGQTYLTIGCLSVLFGLKIVGCSQEENVWELNMMSSFRRREWKSEHIEDNKHCCQVKSALFCFYRPPGSTVWLS